MVDVSTESNIGSITITGVQRATSVTAISGSQQGSSISATSDTAQYWSKMSQRYAEESQESSLEAKDWANKLGSTVDGEEYSSKHYAQITQETATNAVADITSTKDGALTEITTAQELALTDISATQSSALTEIGDLKNSSLTEISASLENATGNITDAQSNAVEAVSTLGDNYISNINTTGDKYIADIGNAGENYIDNINATGKGFNNLTQRQITNCLLEVPQRIKYDLADGTLTIKAGSVVIVPYGVEDLTAQYSVGTTFLNDNFNVVDTQYASGKFFVWAEVQNDIASATTITDTNSRLLEINLTINKFQCVSNNISGTTKFTGTGNCTNYRTDLNLVQKYEAGVLTNEVISLPIMLVKADGAYIAGSISQVFNGMGYIGSTVWVDKGVKGLFPNGRNQDGSLNNIEVTVDKLSTHIPADTVSRNRNLILERGSVWSCVSYEERDETPAVNSAVYQLWFNTSENKYYYHNEGDTAWKPFAEKLIRIGSYDWDATNKKISNFKNQKTFRAIDFNHKPIIAGWGMPSDNVQTLTLGTSGTYYRAPANGYFAISGELTNTEGYVNMSGGGVNSKCNGYSKGADCNIFLPVKKNQTIIVQYSNFAISQSYMSFRFVYAEGDQS